jgi:tetraacyldisaccharide 4'-kinase
MSSGLQEIRLKQETYRRIVSGRDRSTAAGMLRVLLRVLSGIYGPIVSVRNKLYDAGFLKSYPVTVPVVCIGNITAGGTGKTPLVIWLCRYLRDKGLRCAILTRGYKTRPGEMTDEPALLAKACGDVPVVVDSDRVRGARKAIEHHKAQVLVLDDGFQHRRLRRDLDIIAIDATCSFGFGKMLPAGLLRESPRSLKRAKAAVITRSNHVEPEALEAVEQKIHTYAPGLPVAKTVHRHTWAVTFQNRQIGLDELKGKPVYAFCGIGNPEAFFSSIEQSGLKLAGTEVFDDHYAYTQEDMKHIYKKARKCGADVLLCTQKDWVKSALAVPKPEEEKFTFAYLAMELDFVDGFDKIKRLLDAIITGNLTDTN